MAHLFSKRATLPAAGRGPPRCAIYFCVRLRPYLRDPCVWWLRELRLPRCICIILAGIMNRCDGRKWFDRVVRIVGRHFGIVPFDLLANRKGNGNKNRGREKLGKFAGPFEDRAVLLLEIWRKQRLERNELIYPVLYPFVKIKRSSRYFFFYIIHVKMFLGMLLRTREIGRNKKDDKNVLES